MRPPRLPAVDDVARFIGRVTGRAMVRLPKGFTHDVPTRRAPEAMEACMAMKPD